MTAAPATSDEGRRKAFATYVVPEIDIVAGASAGRAEALVKDTLLRSYRGFDAFDGRHPRAVATTFFTHGVGTELDLPAAPPTA